MITDNEPFCSKFQHMTKEMSGFSCGVFVAGLIESILGGIGFKVKVHALATPTSRFPSKTVYLIKGGLRE